MSYNQLKKETSQKYLNRYVPKSLTEKQKEEVSKIILDRRKGKSTKITPSFDRPSRKSTYTVQFNKRYGDIKDKSIRNLAKYFKIQPLVLNTVYNKASAAWFTSGSRLGINREQWSKARVYKGILNILEIRKNGIEKYPQRKKTEGNDYSLIQKAIQFNSSYIP